MLSTFVASGLSIFMYPETAHAAVTVSADEVNTFVIAPLILGTVCVLGA